MTFYKAYDSNLGIKVVFAIKAVNALVIPKNDVGASWGGERGG